MPVWNFRGQLLSLLFGAASVAAQADTLEHIGTFIWPTESVMGLSGLEVTADGSGFGAVSDRGWYLTGRFARDGVQISDIELLTYDPILDGDGLPVSARRTGDLSDAEGLAIGPDGTIWISFERWARVARFDAITDPAGWIADHPSFADYADNRQLEALALSPDGVLYAFAEHAQDAGFAIYRLDSAGWVIAGHIARENRFAIVGADFDVQGRLYLLERKLVLGLWWQNRVRRLDVTRPDEVAVLWTSARGAYDNIEGIAVWQDAQGPRITLVSDDNGDPDEPAQFIEFRVLASDQ